MSSNLAIIEKYIYDNTSGITIVYENTTYDPDDNEKWMRIAIQHVADTTETIVGNRNSGIKEEYLLFLQIFIPKSTGVKALDDLINSFRSLLENADISNFIFGNITVNNVGLSGAWFQKNIVVPFHIHR